MSDPGGKKGKPGGKSRTLGSRQDASVQVDLIKKKGRCRSCMSCSVWTMAVIGAVLATLPVWNVVLDKLEYFVLGSRFTVTSSMLEDLGMEGVSLFKQHDRDDDGYLSLEEFEPLAHRLMDVNGTEPIVYNLTIEEWDEVVTIKSFFEPLQLETMSKYQNEGLESHTGPLDTLHGLKFWKEPAHKWYNFGATHMNAFLPEDVDILHKVGEPYYLIKTKHMLETMTISSNRYLPPPLMGPTEIMIHRLLAMFHPRPFVYSRFNPRGSIAVVRAHNDMYVDVMFRIHAEFQLNKAPFYPFWFTPAQFTGHVIMSKDGTKLLYFNMIVPTDKRLNVDMEWLNGPKENENMEVDIGFMPTMELESTRTSIHVMYGGQDNRDRYIEPTEGYLKSVRDIKWKEEISEKEAARNLEVELYPFKKVTYYNFTEAYHVARQELKPIHSILLWGALDDQSC